MPPKCNKRLWLILCGISTFFLLLGIIFAKPNNFSWHARSHLDNRIIAIDPGHGGIDSGSTHAGITEKEITLALSNAIALELQNKGATVIMTRSADVDLWNDVSIEDEVNFTKIEYEQDLKLGTSIDPRDRGIALGNRRPPTYRLGLRARLLIAERNNAELFISIHTNHFRSESAKGAVTLYQAHSLHSQRLAIGIQTHLDILLPGRSAPGIVADDFFILRRSKVPAVIVEIGFVSNKNDREFMMSTEGQKAIAKAIAGGLEDYFKGL